MLAINLMGQIRFDPGTDGRVELDLSTWRLVAGRIEGLARQVPLSFHFMDIPIHDMTREPAGLFVPGSQQSNAVTKTDGTFTSGPIMAGMYRLTIGLDGGGHVQRDVQIPPRVPGGGADPVDLGTLKLHRPGS